MSLNKLMSGNKKITSIHVDEIRNNDLNNYNLESVDALAKSIEKYGQNASGVVYNEILTTDDKQYTLIGGHQRHLAISKLYQEGKHDGMMLVKVIQKPKNEIEEKEAIRQDNIQRRKTHDEILKEVEEESEMFELLKDTDLDPRKEKGWLNKRKWIADRLGYRSDKTIQPYINELKAKKSLESKENETKAVDENKEKKKNVYTPKKASKDITSIVKKLSKVSSSLEEFKDADLTFILGEKKEERKLNEFIKKEISRLSIILKEIEKAQNKE